MNPEAERGEERALEVDAEDPWPGRGRRHLAEGCEKPVLGGGDEGREVGGDARLEEGFPCAAVPVGGRVEQVYAGEAVDLEVDEARHRDAVAVRGAESDGRDSPTSDLDVAADET